jgi:hypothetical protein
MCPCQAIEVEDKLHSFLVGSGILYAVLICLTATLIFVSMSRVADGVVGPIKDLSQLCDRILADDLSATITAADVEAASSADMHQVLRSFSGMVVALRFGSDSYFKGDLNKTEEVFEEALTLFGALGHSRGVGLSSNNLALVRQQKGQLSEAESLFRNAVRSHSPSAHQHRLRPLCPTRLRCMQADPERQRVRRRAGTRRSDGRAGKCLDSSWPGEGRRGHAHGCTQKG